MIWVTLHLIASATMTALAIYTVLRWNEQLLLLERLGLGLIGGCSFLRLNVILETQNSPFFEWAPTLMTCGFVLLIWGLAVRRQRHELANLAQLREAKRHLKARGKL